MTEVAEPKPPGELVFTALMFLGSLVLLAEAWRIEGPPGRSGPGIFPLIAAGCITLSTLTLLIRGWRSRRTASLERPEDAPPEPTGKAALATILPPFVAIFMGLATLYVVAVEPLGFWIATALFLPIAMLILYDRRPLRILAITAGSMAFAYVVFAFIFRVYLP